MEPTNTSWIVPWCETKFLTKDCITETCKTVLEEFDKVDGNTREEHVCPIVLTRFGRGCKTPECKALAHHLKERESFAYLIGFMNSYELTIYTVDKLHTDPELLGQHLKTPQIGRKSIIFKTELCTTAWTSRNLVTIPFVSASKGSHGANNIAKCQAHVKVKALNTTCRRFLKDVILKMY